MISASLLFSADYIIAYLVRAKIFVHWDFKSEEKLKGNNNFRE